MESNAITVKSSRIFATRLMLFCVGNAVDDDVIVNRIFLVNPVCSLQVSYTALNLARILARILTRILARILALILTRSLGILQVS